MPRKSRKQTSNYVPVSVSYPDVSDRVEAMERAGLDPMEWTVVKASITKLSSRFDCVPRTCWDNDTFRAKVEKGFKQAAPKKFRAKPRPKKTGILAEMAIYDPHIGKLGWGPEVGKDFDVDIGRDRYLSAFDTLLGDALLYQPERWLYVVGNDMLHVDTGANTTTKGTPQDTDGRWQRSYLYASQMIIDCTARMRETAPVDIVVVPGNHDEERMFTLGHAISCQFHADPAVTVDNQACLQKVYSWHGVFIGLEHGVRLHKAAVMKVAPQLYMNRYADRWANSTWKEIHHGHIHTEREYNIRTVADTVGDTIIRSIPAISGTDKWHYNNGYYSPVSAECHIYDKRCRRGYAAYTPEN
jgi:hypothetical protein